MMCEANLKPPKFEITTFFRAIFYRNPEYALKRVEGVSVEKKLVEGLVERLAESQRKILAKVKDNPYMSKKELSDKIGISTTAIDKNISQLKKKGLLKRVGPDKGGHWEVAG